LRDVPGTERRKSFHRRQPASKIKCVGNDLAPACASPQAVADTAEHHCARYGLVAQQSQLRQSQSGNRWVTFICSGERIAARCGTLRFDSRILPSRLRSMLAGFPTRRCLGLTHCAAAALTASYRGGGGKPNKRYSARRLSGIEVF
jgi:hypothetical protein